MIGVSKERNKVQTDVFYLKILVGYLPIMSIATGDLLDLLTLSRDGKGAAKQKQKTDVADRQIELNKVWSDTMSDTDVYEADFDVGAFLLFINQ